MRISKGLRQAVREFAWADIATDGVNTDITGEGVGKELVIGDCRSTGGNAIGASTDRKLNGGDGDDIVVGDNGAAGLAKGNGKKDKLLGGADKDRLFGDHQKVKGGKRKGGGKADKANGGDGNDRLEGGPKRKDKCIGGKGKDKANRSCEIIVSVP